MRFFITVTSLLLLISCGHNNRVSDSKVDKLSFPYQSYLDNIGEDECFPTIGNDGKGFNAITDKIVYPELPDTLSESHYADSLLQYYNIDLALSSIHYDVSTAERYITEREFRLEYANALDSINLSGITDLNLKNLIYFISQKAADAIRKGVRPTELDFPEMNQFKDALIEISTQIYKAHPGGKVKYIVEGIIQNYKDIHTKAISDTSSFRNELLDMVIYETDFQRQCVLARELAYANYQSSERDDKQVVAVLDRLLRSGKYSPLLGELWRMWRCIIQREILGCGGDDSAMYNLFYNEMKNRLALVYIAQITKYDDKLAYKEFLRLANENNIVRNSEFLCGNNVNSDYMELFYSVFNPDSNEENL